MATKYAKLCDEQAAVMNAEPLPVVEEETGNASTDGSTVFVNPKWMESLEADSGQGAVRFVLSHELGHAEAGMGGGGDAELGADRFAARSVARQGFDFEAISGVEGHLNAQSTESHPAAWSRMAVARQDFDRQRARDEEIAKKRLKARERAAVPRRVRADRNRVVREHTI